MLTNAPDARNTGNPPPSGRGSARLRQLDGTVALAALRTLGTARRKRPRPATVQKIGLMKTAGIGDMILLCAIAHDTLEAFPDAEFVIVAGPENAQLATLIPRSRVLKLPTAKPWQVIPLLRAERLDAFVDFGQWTRVEGLYTSLSRARWTAGFETPGQRRHYAYDATARHRDDVSEIDNYRALIATLGVTSTSLPSFEPVPGTPEPTSEPYVIFHLWPGGFRSELREWPADHWRALATRLIDDGLTVVLTGGPDDVARTQAFIDSCPDAGDRMLSIAGRYRLTEMVGVLAGARCVISVNTGVMHMAAAAGAFTIALNGPTSSRRWGPLGPDVVNLDSELVGCGFLNLGFEYDGQRLDCMQGISVDRVLAAIEGRVRV
jgi:heptosyltransferase III